MSTLQSHASVRAIAEVLYAARVLGSDAWNAIGHDQMTQPSESSLGADVLELFSLLQQRNISYLLVGGVALLKYIDGRNTQDIDLVISLESLAHLPEIVVSDQNQSFARGRFKNLRVDLLLTSNPLFEQVRAQFATTHSFNELDVRCATVEGLIVMKLYALPSLYQQGDGQRIAIYETDILMLCQRHHPSFAPLLEIVRPHVEAGQYGELKKIVTDIEQRLSRMSAGLRKDQPPDSSK
jgi:hypothetical protein